MTLALRIDCRDVFDSIGPVDWADQVREVARSGVHVVKTTAGPGSLDESPGLDYRVSTTTAVLTALPWLPKVLDAITERISDAVDLDLRWVEETEYGVNLNFHAPSEGTGARYELHEDLVGLYTLIAYFDDLEAEGGGLVVGAPGAPILTVTPKPGLVAVVRRQVPHQVTPLENLTLTRTAMPVVLVPRDGAGVDVPGYDSWLYGE